MKKYFLFVLTFIFVLNSCEKIEGPYNLLEGCTDIDAFNYNENAGIDDGNCCYIEGCTDINALNYDSLACFDNDSCEYANGDIAGCTDSLFSNYNPLATIDNGSCIPYLKNVLIEDFTGHTCPNCPGAATELEAIHNLYGEQIIGMAIHVSNTFARPYPESQAPKFQYDFRTEWGDNWDASNLFDISNSGLPKGMVNRIGYPNEHKLGVSEWLSAVDLELSKNVDLGIKIESNSTKITISTRILSNISGNYNLVVCLTENEIINWQKDGSDNIEDYEHNHVLRTVLYDGEFSSSNSFSIGNKYEKTIDYNLADLEQYNVDYSANDAFMGNGIAGGWNYNNLQIIAYIYDANTKEILQVKEKHLNH